MKNPNHRQNSGDGAPAETGVGQSAERIIGIDPARYHAAPDFSAYLEGVREHRELWTGIYRRVRLNEDQLVAARALGTPPRLLALSEDWCGDAANTLPVVARLAEAAGWDLRVLARDENLDIMDAHLTGGRSRSIPIVIGYDGDFRELGWWGPRPAELQTWVISREAQAMEYDDRYKVARRWYARDRGRTTIAELLKKLSPPI